MNPILILHAPDSLLQAKMLWQELDLLEYLSETVDSLNRRSSRTAIHVAREKLNDAPAIILMGSPQLFTDQYYLETALMSLTTKVHVPITYGQIDLKAPDWFENPIVLVGEGVDTVRSWNRLIARLNPLIGYF